MRLNARNVTIPQLNAPNAPTDTTFISRHVFLHVLLAHIHHKHLKDVNHVYRRAKHVQTLTVAKLVFMVTYFTGNTLKTSVLKVLHVQIIITSTQIKKYVNLSALKITMFHNRLKLVLYHVQAI